MSGHMMHIVFAYEHLVQAIFDREDADRTRCLQSMKSISTYVSQSRHRNFSPFSPPWRHLQNGDHPGAIGNNKGLVIDEGKAVGSMQTRRFHFDATGQIHALASYRNGDFHIDH